MLNSHVIPQETMFDFFGRIEEDEILDCFNQLMQSNRQNGKLVAEIAVKYAQKINSNAIITILENFGTNDGLIYYLMNVLPHTEDQDIYFKYIECCVRLSNFKEVERVIRETKCYDPVKVRDFLKECKIADPRPLIYLCDMHGYIDDLTKFLYETRQQKCIEIFLFKVNSQASPQVLGTLLDLDCDEAYIKQLLLSIRNCSIEDLVNSFEERGKLRMLTTWLESRFDERI
jgi:clathrin heavy chain